MYVASERRENPVMELSALLRAHLKVRDSRATRVFVNDRENARNESSIMEASRGRFFSLSLSLLFVKQIISQLGKFSSAALALEIKDSREVTVNSLSFSWGISWFYHSPI